MKTRVCDICEKRCDSGAIKAKRWGIVGPGGGSNQRLDICSSCVEEIKKARAGAKA